MKKIVGIIAAAALLATSVFAADISAKVQLEGSLFNYDGATEAMSMFEIDKPSDQAWNPIFNTSVNGDKAGAKFCVFTGVSENVGGWNGGKQVGAKDFQVWMSPADGFKLIFGANDFNLNQEHITWSKTDSGIGGDFGYSLAYNSNGIGIDLMLNPGWGNKWMSKAKNGDAVMGKLGFKFTYGADFGTINFLLSANNAKDKDGKVKNFNDLKFGAGYANNFGGVNMFVNVLGYLNNGDFNKLRAEIYAEGSADSLSWKVFQTFVLLPQAKKNNVEVGLVARADFALDGFGAYVYFESANFLADPFSMEIKPGVSGNLGGAGWDVALSIKVAKKVSIGVPVSFNYGW